MFRAPRAPGIYVYRLFDEADDIDTYVVAVSAVRLTRFQVCIESVIRCDAFGTGCCYKSTASDRRQFYASVMCNLLCALRYVIGMLNKSDSLRSGLTQLVQCFKLMQRYLYTAVP
jgi:hypothetical protein